MNQEDGNQRKEEKIGTFNKVQLNKKEKRELNEEIREMKPVKMHKMSTKEDERK